MERHNIFFILLRPLFLGNIGSTARVLKNFGYANLRLVSPPRNYKDAEARRMAVGAFDLLKASLIFNDLNEALADIEIAIGTSCGYQRATQLTPLTEIGPRLSAASGGKKVAIIFGDERDGMTRQEMDCCHYVVNVPTDPAFPSLNVAQAVGLFAYELSRSYGDSPDVAEELADGPITDQFFADLAEVLQESGFTRSYNKKSIMTELRELFQKAAPSPRELQLLVGVLRKIEQRIKSANKQS
jgi:TrmH family RNA methyltransferase